jgi:hypothetical protein
MTLLKGNLKALGNEELYAHLLTKTEFELHWTTFFDLYDTLESFGTHLTKVINHCLTSLYRPFGSVQKCSTCTLKRTMEFQGQGTSCTPCLTLGLGC